MFAISITRWKHSRFSPTILTEKYRLLTFLTCVVSARCAYDVLQGLYRSPRICVCVRTHDVSEIAHFPSIMDILSLIAKISFNIDSFSICLIDPQTFSYNKVHKIKSTKNQLKDFSIRLFLEVPSVKLIRKL